MEFDSREEVLDATHSPTVGLDSFINEGENDHDLVGERIRRLEAVFSRANQNRQQRQSQRTNNQAVDLSAALNIQDGNALNGKSERKDGIYLVAKALAANTETKAVKTVGGGFFDCNICSGIPQDPILTCCGHLFCWPCFYHLSCAYSSVKECPRCKGEVTETSITPVYGHGNYSESCDSKLKASGLMVPPRPIPHRNPSKRQQQANRGRVPPAATMSSQERANGRRRFSSRLVAMAIENNQTPLSTQASRYLAPPTNSVGSATDFADRSVEDESYTDTQNVINTSSDSLHDTVTASQRQSQIHEISNETTTIDISSRSISSSSITQTDFPSGSVLESERRVDLRSFSSSRRRIEVANADAAAVVRPPRRRRT